MLTEWHVAHNENQNIDETEFMANAPEQYRVSFDIFNSISQILLAPECYWMKPICANALGQFFLNTDVLKKFAAGTRGLR